MKIQSYLHHITTRLKNKDIRETLFMLIPYNIIHAPVSNVTFSSAKTDFNMFFPALEAPIPSEILHVIYTKESWTGNNFLIKHDGELTYANFKNDITITINDLFVFEDELPNLNLSFPKTTPKIAESNATDIYKVIGILLDTTVKNKNNIIPISKYKFKSQTELIQRIANEGIYGMGKSTLEGVFAKAKRAIHNNDTCYSTTGTETNLYKLIGAFINILLLEERKFFTDIDHVFSDKTMLISHIMRYSLDMKQEKIQVILGKSVKALTS